MSEEEDILDRVNRYYPPPPQTTVMVSTELLRKVEWEIMLLRDQVKILKDHVNEDVYQRLAIENGWPHEIGNPLGRWCCQEHEKAFRDGTLYPLSP